jgi:hypothetical protein
MNSNKRGPFIGLRLASRIGLKFCLIGSRLLAISTWKDDKTNALAERIGAARLLDKANLANLLIPAIKNYAGASERIPGVSDHSDRTGFQASTFRSGSESLNLISQCSEVISF